MHFPWRNIISRNEDEKYMIEALKLAWKAFENGEVPVGAVLVKDDKIIAKGLNQVESLQDATAHAEMLCLTSIDLDNPPNWRKEATLYVTLEPCIMCAGAILLSRLNKLVWGAPNNNFGANGSLTDVFILSHPLPPLKIIKGVLEAPCGEILKVFFQKQRNLKEKKECDDARLV